MPTIELVDTPDLANYYTKAQVDAGFAVLTHDHDTRYYTKAQSDAAYAVIGHTHTFASLTSKPTTIGGYGITDFNSLGDARWSLLAHTHTFASKDGITGITGTPDGTTFLRGDGVWAVPSGGGGSPGGSTTQIQYNNAGAFGGDANNVWDAANGRQIIGGSFITSLTSTTTGRRLWVGNNVSGYGRMALVGKVPVADTDFAGASIEFAISRLDNVYKRLYTITGDVLNGSDLTSRVLSIVDNQNAGFNLLSFASSGNATFGGLVTPNGGLNIPVGVGAELGVNFGGGSGSIRFSGGIMYLGNASQIIWRNGDPYAVGNDVGFGFSATGIVEINNGTAGTFRDLTLRAITLTGSIISTANSYFAIKNGSQYTSWFNWDAWTIGNTSVIGFAATADTAASAGDTCIARNAAGVLEINNGTRGTFRDLTARKYIAGGGATITADTPLFSGSQTWNNVATTFKGIYVNITNTTSAATSRILDLQAGGNTVFSVAISGALVALGVTLGGSAAAPDLIIGSSNTTQSYRFIPGSGIFRAGSIAQIGWSSGDPNVSATDTGLNRNAAGILEINNGTAGTLRDLTLRDIIGTGYVRSSSPTSGIGYATGAGGTVTQTANKSNGVTLNKICGQITMNGAALAAAAKVFFVVTNSTVVATDVIQVEVVSGGTANAYRAWVAAVGAGVFTIGVENVTAGSLSEAPVIGFFVNKAVTS